MKFAKFPEPGGFEKRNKHYCWAVFYVMAAGIVLKSGSMAIVLGAVLFSILWVLAQITGLSWGLSHPELGITDHLALLELKGPGIFLASLVTICLLIAAIEYLLYRRGKR